MSQSQESKADAAQQRSEETRSFVRTVKAATRRRYTPEEKLRVVLEGFRREVTVNDLCRREGIKPHSYYAWTKEFMEAGKERLTRETVRDATGQEIQQLRRDNYELKQLVADLSLEVYRIKKTAIPVPADDVGTTHERVREDDGPGQGSFVHASKASGTQGPGCPKSTYYRWLTREQRCQGLENQPGGGLAPWNRLSQPEEQAVLTVARRAPELSCRQLAAWITDNQGFSVSESTVYRILRREGLVKSPEMQLKAGKEYRRKTTGPNQMWATDASYFKVIGWGYYYLVTVMDDFSRFILAHKLQRGMTSDSFIEVVQDAVDKTGMTEIPVQDRTRLLSDNGSSYVTSSSSNSWISRWTWPRTQSSNCSHSDLLSRDTLNKSVDYGGIVP